jgi:hypothetical protein
VGSQVEGRSAESGVNDMVSIQFVSPASGEYRLFMSNLLKLPQVSIQFVSPASGEKYKLKFCHKPAIIVSIQFVSPASGESSLHRPYPERDSAVKSTHR